MERACEGLAVAVWSAIMVTAFITLGPYFERPGLTIDVMVDRLEDTYAQLKGICATAG